VQTSQDEIFLASEGDQWFVRNKAALAEFDPASDGPIRLMELYRLRPRRVLEVGASNGVRLAAVAERYQARVVAVEPSQEAVLDGQKRYPHVAFCQGVAHAIPLHEQFDLIIVNFVFHWIDRQHLLSSVAEIDRLLSDGGSLIIGDFFPTNLTKVHYHHLPKQHLFTFKQDYSAMFLVSGLYRCVATLSADHGGHGSLHAESSEETRIAHWLLRKDISNLYGESSYPQGPRAHG